MKVIIYRLFPAKPQNERWLAGCHAAHTLRPATKANTDVVEVKGSPGGSGRMGRGQIKTTDNRLMRNK